MVPSSVQIQDTAERIEDGRELSICSRSLVEVSSGSFHQDPRAKLSVHCPGSPSGERHEQQGACEDQRRGQEAQEVDADHVVLQATLHSSI